MSFQVSDFSDLVRLLQEHPEWQTQLRNVLLSDDFLALPNIVRQLGESMDQLTARVDRLGERIDQLTARIDERFAEMDRRFAEIDRKFELIDRRFDEIDRKFELIDQRFDEIDRKFELIDRRFDEIDRKFELIDRRFDKMENDIGSLKGWRLEDHFQKNGGVFFARLLKRSQVVPKEVLVDRLYDCMSEDEFEQALLVDVIVKGKVREPAYNSCDVYLALEVSHTINQTDIDRAVERAELISRMGTPTIPVVAGASIREEELEMARSAKVVVYCNGRISLWQEALAQYAQLN
jgi:predicted nuclease with TOPRIM domain